MVKIQGTFLITMAKIQGRCNNSTLLQGKKKGPATFYSYQPLSITTTDRIVMESNYQSNFAKVLRAVQACSYLL